MCDGSCTICGSAHPVEHEATACLEFSKQCIAHLLRQVGRPAKCKGCNADIFFVRHLNGKQVPYTPDGLNHFANCPTAQRFRAAFKRPEER